jgi:hypothetical protein
VAVSRRLATAQSDHDGRKENPRKGSAALVLITALSAGLGQFGSGRRGCRCNDTHPPQHDSRSWFASGRVEGLAEFGQEAAAAFLTSFSAASARLRTSTAFAISAL